MKKSFPFLTAILIVLASVQAQAERVRLNLSYDGLFDNREFKNDMLPQTIYGMRLIPEIGIDQNGHRIMGGVSKIWEFGAYEQPDPEIVLYYNYQGETWSAYFGAIPRRCLQRQLPDAFLYDSIAFFEPTIGGTAIQYAGESFQTELYCNWFSRQSYNDREAFRIVTDGLWKAGAVSMGWFGAMTHFAKPKEPGHFIYEKFQFNPYIGLDLNGIAPNTTVRLQAGALTSLVRCRKDEKWHTPTGFLGNIQAVWKWFDVKSTFFAGGKQQPFLDDPEAGLTFHRSDPFYNHTFYNRTELGVTFIADKYVEFGFRWNMHFTPDTPMHNQQMITVRYCFDPLKVNRNRQ